MSGAPGYLALHASGELLRRRDAALARLSGCALCPRRCGVNSPLDRMLLPEEYCQALELADQAGLTRREQRDFAAMRRGLGVV